MSVVTTIVNPGYGSPEAFPDMAFSSCLQSMSGCPVLCRGSTEHLVTRLKLVQRTLHLPSTMFHHAAAGRVLCRLESMVCILGPFATGFDGWMNE